MLNKVIKAVLGVLATVALLGAFAAHAQKAPPVTGEANDHTSPGATQQPEGNMRPTDAGTNTGIVPPKTGEANDHTSANAVQQGTPKAKTTKPKVKHPAVKAPVTGEANDHSSAGGTTEAAKAAKAAKAASM